MKIRILAKLLFLSLFVFSSLSCNKKEEVKVLNPDIEKYLNEMIGLMKTYSINKDVINWVEVEKDVKTKALGFNSVSEIGLAIQYAISSLRDGHSSFIAKNGQVYSGFVSYSECQKLAIGFVQVPNEKVGYIKIEGFTGNAAASKAHAEFLQTTIKSLDKVTLKGWIIDLRGNTGGNMWPMLAGVGPILGNGVCGAFITSSNQISKWSYTNGIAQIETTKIVEVTNPYNLLNQTYKVAVLTDNATASSGEAIAIAFKNTPNSKSFGLRTCGVSTANAGFPMSDGATLNMTTSFMADRTLKKYGETVTPDIEEVVAFEQINKAVTWILE